MSVVFDNIRSSCLLPALGLVSCAVPDIAPPSAELYESSFSYSQAHEREQLQDKLDLEAEGVYVSSHILQDLFRSTLGFSVFECPEITVDSGIGTIRIVFPLSLPCEKPEGPVDITISRKTQGASSLLPKKFDIQQTYKVKHKDGSKRLSVDIKDFRIGRIKLEVSEDAYDNALVWCSSQPNLIGSNCNIPTVSMSEPMIVPKTRAGFVTYGQDAVKNLSRQGLINVVQRNELTKVFEKFGYLGVSVEVPTRKVKESYDLLPEVELRVAQYVSDYPTTYARPIPIGLKRKSSATSLDTTAYVFALSEHRVYFYFLDAHVELEDLEEETRAQLRLLKQGPDIFSMSTSDFLTLTEPCQSWSEPITSSYSMEEGRILWLNLDSLRPDSRFLKYFNEGLCFAESMLGHYVKPTQVLLTIKDDKDRDSTGFRYNLTKNIACSVDVTIINQGACSEEQAYAFGIETALTVLASQDLLSTSERSSFFNALSNFFLQPNILSVQELEKLAVDIAEYQERRKYNSPVLELIDREINDRPFSVLAESK